MINTEGYEHVQTEAMELSDETLDLVLGGDGTSAYQPAPQVDLNIKPIDVSIRIEYGPEAAAIDATTRQHVVDAGIQALQNSQTVDQLDELGAAMADIATDALNGAADFVGDVFSAIGDFFGSSGSGG